MNKKLIRLTESDLHRIVKESVNRVLNEASFRDLIKNRPQKNEKFISDYESDGFRRIKENGKYNYIDKQGQLLKYGLTNVPTLVVEWLL